MRWNMLFSLRGVFVMFLVFWPISGLLAPEFFTGNFLRHNDTAGRTIVQQMGRWNKLAAADTMPSEKAAEQVNAYFFRHEGFFGSVGALIRNKVSRIESPRLGPTNDVESKTPPALDLDLGKTATPLSRSPGSRPFAGYKAT